MDNLPLSKVQYAFLDIFTNPHTTPLFHDQFLLRWAYLVTPATDVRRLRRAHDHLVKRHDTLRLHFDRVEGRWVGRIPDAHPTGLIVEDIGDVDEEAFRHALNQRAGARMDVLSKQLFEIRLLRFGRRGDVILVRMHHILADGYSSLVLFEELFKLMLNMQLEVPAISHLAYVQYENRSLARNVEEKDAYWENELLPMGPSPNSGRKRKGIDIASNTRITSATRLGGVVTACETAQLANRAAENGETLFNYLLASFCDVLCAESGASDVIVGVNVSRVDRKLQGYIGNANRTLLIRFWHDPDKSLDEIAALAGSKLRTGLQHSPWANYAGTGPVADAFRENRRRATQYMVHSPETLGRLRSSKVANALQEIKSETLSLGAFQVSRLELPESPPTNRELQLTIHDLGDCKHATLDADADAYTQPELADLKRRIRVRLELDSVSAG